MYLPDDLTTFPDIPDGIRGDVERVAAYLYRYTWAKGPAWVHLSPGEKDAWRKLAQFVIDGQ